MNFYYVLRSRQDGSYLVAHPKPGTGYLLLFSEAADALSYLNTHAGESIRPQFSTENVSSSQLEALLKRWGFQGFGMVQDPLLPSIEFLKPNL
jgi:hypothetical protein